MLLLPTTVLAAEGATASTDAGIYDVLIPLIVLLPILGFAFTALFGRRLQLRFGRGAAEIVPIGHHRADLADRAGRDRARAPARRAVRRGGPRRHALDVDPGRRLQRRHRLPRGRADRLPPDRRDHDRHARARVLDRVHGPRQRHVAVLRLPQPVHVLDARCWCSPTAGCWCSPAGSWWACRATR